MVNGLRTDIVLSEWILVQNRQVRLLMIGDSVGPERSVAPIPARLMAHHAYVARRPGLSRKTAS